MSTKTLSLDEKLYNYILSISLREPEVLQKLRDENRFHKFFNMQISPDQGQFMSLIARIMNAKYYLEVGTFTGYSSIVVGLSMGKNSRLVCCDESKEYTDVAKKYWMEAGIIDQISLKLGQALASLQELLDTGYENRFDLMFIDADKENYDLYYELGLSLIRPGGLILIDNVLWNGAVVDSLIDDEATNAIRHLNMKILSDSRVNPSVIPIGDGLTLAQKHY